MESVRSDAPFVHVRLRDGEVVQGFSCEGSDLTVGDQTLFRTPGAMLARECERRDGALRTTVTQPRLG